MASAIDKGSATTATTRPATASWARSAFLYPLRNASRSAGPGNSTSLGSAPLEIRYRVTRHGGSAVLLVHPGSQAFESYPPCTALGLVCESVVKARRGQARNPPPLPVGRGRWCLRP